MNFPALRKTLKVFLDLLGLSRSSEMVRSMRMIGITLFALGVLTLLIPGDIT
jgi:hypothetical protein